MNVCNSSRLVRTITNYSISYGRYNSFIGHNARLCSIKYMRDICSGEVNARCVGLAQQPLLVINQSSFWDRTFFFGATN